MFTSWFKRFNPLQNERGSIIVIVSMGLAALVGLSALVTDYGAVALERRRLVTAADAAALAGAQELLKDLASSALAHAAAVNYASANGVDPDSVAVTVPPNQREILVQVENDVDFFFARIFGQAGTRVGARARAIVGPIGAMIGIVPFSIVEQPLVFGAPYELKFANWDDSGLGSGSFGALALGGTGASKYRANIVNGYNGEISIGDVLDLEQGNMSGPTAQGINELIKKNCGCTLHNYEPNCPLLIYIPVIRYLGASKKVEIVSFAAFFINKDKPPKPGNKNVVTGAFIEHVAGGKVSQNSSSSYGVYAVNLVE